MSRPRGTLMRAWPSGPIDSSPTQKIMLTIGCCGTEAVALKLWDICGLAPEAVGLNMEAVGELASLNSRLLNANRSWKSTKLLLGKACRRQMLGRQNHMAHYKGRLGQLGSWAACLPLWLIHTLLAFPYRLFGPACSGHPRTF